MLGNLQVRFGGGRMEKGCNRLSSDLETGISHSLASRLPDCRSWLTRPVGLAMDFRYHVTPTPACRTSMGMA